MKSKPLTKAEKAWIEELEAVLSRCPSTRFSAYTIGDADIVLYEKNVATAWEEANSNLHLDAPELHRRAGSRLIKIIFPFQIDSCAG